MSAITIKFIDVTFSYNTSVEPVFSSTNIHFTKGWTGIVGPNGAGKSTVAKIAAGLLPPTSGTITTSEKSTPLYLEQDVACIPEDAHDFVLSTESSAGKICSILGIKKEWVKRWLSLSYGERKRLQIGIALWKEPDIFVLDEPLNHLDIHTKKLLLSSLLTYNGTGIIVSHEREFLNQLCHSCIFMRSGQVVLRKGNFNQGFTQQQIEDITREKEYTIALSKYKNIKKRAISLKQHESGKKKKLSKKNIARHDHDAKSKIDGARLTGKDKTGARKAKVLEKRADKSKNTATSLYFKQRKVEGIIFQGKRSQSNTLVKIGKQRIPLGPDRNLLIPDIKISPADRIALTGKNGSGKSTLLSFMIPSIKLDSDKILYIPQEIDSELWQTAHENLKNLDNKKLGHMFTAVHRLGSEPEKVIYSASPSPGEKRKIMLGLGLLKEPSIIIMDEPTNHMDMPSIQCIETALQQFNGALLIISHDMTFIKKTTDIIWEISGNEEKTELKIIDSQML